MLEKVLVLGGSGFLGQSLQQIKPNWVYASSIDCDLLNKNDCREFFELIKPAAIVHLAARVGGIKANALNQAEFYYNNMMMNTNVIHEAKNANIPRVLSTLSTCSFPDKLSSYPFSENDILQGPPAKTNLTYGFTKRALYIQSNAYRQQYNLNYSCFAPCNLYGPGDDFNNEESHFVAAMIRKIANAKEGDLVEFWGTGKPLRQQLYIKDLARLIPVLLEKHNSTLPLIVAPKENLSIKSMVKTCIKISKKEIKPVFNGALDGQYRKDGDNHNLLKLIGDFEFTDFENGLKETYNLHSQQVLCRD